MCNLLFFIEGRSPHKGGATLLVVELLCWYLLKKNEKSYEKAIILS